MKSKTKSRTASASQELLRKIPSMTGMLRSPAVEALLREHPRPLVVGAVRAALDWARREVRGGRAADDDGALAPGRLESHAASRLAQARRQRLDRVINATGVILHTGLGRAPLPEAAVAELAKQDGYGSLEIDLDSNARGRRDAYVERLLAHLTGAQAACVVNNNAAATVLALAALAEGKEVVVARGQLVEIGGSFRLPEIMERSGAILREVGSTNHVRLSDYAKAIGGNTALLMRVHTSNYKIAGFAGETPIEELAALGRKRRVGVFDDIGSGALVDFSRWGLPEEPSAPRSVKAGADVVCFSADKLLGGPQAGILVGKKKPIELIRRNPFYRIVRPGKLTMAALQATLELYARGEEGLAGIPTLRMIRKGLPELQAQADALADALRGRLPGWTVEVVPGASQLGSGSMPTHDLPTRLVAVRSPTLKPADLAARLRTGKPPVLGRVQGNRLLLDVRTLFQNEAGEVVTALARP